MNELTLAIAEHHRRESAAIGSTQSTIATAMLEAFHKSIANDATVFQLAVICRMELSRIDRKMKSIMARALTADDKHELLNEAQMLLATGELLEKMLVDLNDR